MSLGPFRVLGAALCLLPAGAGVRVLWRWVFFSRLGLCLLGDGADNAASLPELLCALGETVQMECTQLVVPSRTDKCSCRFC